MQRENKKCSSNPNYIKAERCHRLHGMVMRSWTKATSIFVKWCLCFPVYFFTSAIFQLGIGKNAMASTLSLAKNALGSINHMRSWPGFYATSKRSIAALDWMSWILTNSERRVPSSLVKKYCSIWPWPWSIMIVLHILCGAALLQNSFYGDTEISAHYGI